MFRRTTSGARFETVAAAWGGLPPAIALIATNTQPQALRLVICVLAFAVGGFLCGIRAGNRRARHGLVAGMIGVGIYAVFVGLTRVAGALGVGPDPLSIAPSEPGPLALLVGAGMVACAAASAAVGAMLGSAGASRLGV
jgi:hypothetical protein